MSEEEKTQSSQKQAEGKEEKKTASDPSEERIKKINDAADRLELAEKRMAERESSLREAEAVKRIGGTTDAGDPKLTPEQEKHAQAQQGADEITNAFK